MCVGVGVSGPEMEGRPVQGGFLPGTLLAGRGFDTHSPEMGSVDFKIIILFLF